MALEQLGCRLEVGAKEKAFLLPLGDDRKAGDSATLLEGLQRLDSVRLRSRLVAQLGHSGGQICPGLHTVLSAHGVEQGGDLCIG